MGVKQRKRAYKLKSIERLVRAVSFDTPSESFVTPLSVMLLVLKEELAIGVRNGSEAVQTRLPL